MISRFDDPFYKVSATNNYIFYRLVFEGGFSWTEVNQMTWDEVFEANAALDIYIERNNKVMKDAVKKKGV